MSRYTSLKHHFLIAMPHLDDYHFGRSVTYICDHNEDGAVGLIINHPLPLFLPDILSNMGIPHASFAHPSEPVYSGGPLHSGRGFVLHRPTQRQWESTVQLDETLSVTTSRDVLEAIGNNKGPAQVIMALGYAGWGAGQLEEELGDNLWLCCPADPEIFFSVPPADRWSAAAQLAGIELAQMSLEAGHA